MASTTPFVADPRRLGSIVGAVFGAVYVLVNSDALPPAVRLALRGAAVVVAVLICLAACRRSIPSEASATPGLGPAFGPGFGSIVLAEAVALLAGLAIIDHVLHAPRAAVAWVSVVVGAHFIALAARFGEALYLRIGGPITICGLAAFALLAGGAGPVLTDTLGGVVPGVVLLAAGAWGAFAPWRRA